MTATDNKAVLLGALSSSFDAVVDMIAARVIERIGGVANVRAGPRLLRQKDAAQYLGISLSSFKTLRADPSVPIAPVNLNGMPRYRRDDLDKYIDKLKAY